jgi:CRISPR-associated protein Cas1
LGFDGRNRRPPRDPVNAALSLGYTLTHAEAIRACRIAGLDPMLGMLHEPSHGRESLACDLNELARDCVEKLVWRLFAEKTLRAEGFERHAGGVSLNKHARQAFYAAFEKSAPTHRRRLRAAATIFAAHCAFVARGIVGSTAGACGEGTRPIGAETDQ